MRKAYLPALAVAAAIGGWTLSTSANAASSVVLSYAIDGDVHQDVFTDDNGDGFIYGQFSFTDDNNNRLSGQFYTYDDPIVHMSVSAIDSGDASNFIASASLFTPIAAGTYGYSLNGSGGYTDGIPPTGVGLSPILPVGTNDKAVFLGYKDDKLVSGVGVAQFTNNPTQIPLSDTYGPVQDSGTTLVCAAGCASDTLIIAWQGTGDGDGYGLTGQFTNKVAPVPVPAALPLMVSALAAVGLVGMRRKN
jgi:hypothetical protein